MDQSPSWEANKEYAQLVKKFSAFMELEDSSPCSQEPATGPYPQPDESTKKQHVSIFTLLDSRREDKRFWTAW
jgi:hypothetical protein